MCVAALAWKAHPRWPLVAIANRDEYHERPAAPLDIWDDVSGIVGGRDLRSGGTWLGLSPEAGRFALITNLRGFGDPDPSRASRGALVTDLLTGQGAFGDPEAASLDSFNPFNLLLVSGGALRFLTNRPAAVRATLAAGIYGVSNGALDEPWPKTLALKAAVLDWLGSGGDEPSRLFAALASEALPDIGLHPGAPSDIPAEPRETPPFIRNPVYGTRCSTILAIGTDGAGIVAERRFDAAANPTGESIRRFVWPF